MSNMQGHILLCLSLLFPAAGQAGADAKERSHAIPDRSPRVVVGSGFPLPEMVHLAGGTFRTRADLKKKIEAGECTVDAFWIGKHEVTFAQFDRFCEETGYYLKRYRGIDRPLAPFMRAAIEQAARGQGSTPASPIPPAVKGLLPDYPVMQVCWLDAMAYCLWLTQKTGISFRLPTQVEWEYACTVGGSEPRSVVPKELNEVAWCEVNRRRGVSQTQIHPVGRKRPNEAGLHDMYGNVWEWCLDGPREPGYPQAIQEWDRVRKSLSPLDMTRPSYVMEPISALFRGPKALRGGAWCEPVERVTPSYRMFYRQNYIADRVGFRILCTENPTGAVPEEVKQTTSRPAAGDTTSPNP